VTLGQNRLGRVWSEGFDDFAEQIIWVKAAQVFA
jgi:hypothetical protein